MEAPDTTSGFSPPSTACDAVEVACTHAAKKQRLDAAATDKSTRKLHPTGEFPRVVSDNTDDYLTLFFLYQGDDNEPAFKVFVDIDRDGNLLSMDGNDLGLSCPSFLCRFLHKCVDVSNPMITFWNKEGPLQNEVHDEIWEAMKSKAQKNDERLDDDMLETELRDLRNKLSDKYKPFDFCDKAWAQSYDVMMHVHGLKARPPLPRRAHKDSTP